MEAVGEGVRDIAPGDRVVTLFSPQCRECIHCLSPRTNLCLAIRDEQNQLLQQVILDPNDLDGKIAAAEQKMNAVLAQRESWPILERRYKHDDLMIPNQP